MGLLCKNQPKELVHVDLDKRLTEKGLATFFPECCWPPSAAVSKLATKLKTLKARGQESAFVAVDLKECVVLSTA